MSQNLEEVDFIFSERAMDEAICNLHNLGFCDQDPILVADLIKKEYITHELQHFRPIPWLIRVASLTEKGLKRVQTVEAEDLLKPENERLTKDTEYDLNVMDEVYMGFLLFSPKRIQDELKMGRHVRCHIKGHRLWARLRETLLIVLVDIKRRLCGIASVGIR